MTKPKEERDINLLHLYKTGRKYWKSILLAFMISVIAAGALSFMSKPVYRTKVTISIPYLNDSTWAHENAREKKNIPIINPYNVLSFIADLNALRQTASIQILAEKMKIPEQYARSIVFLRARNLTPFLEEVEITMDIYDMSTANEIIDHVVMSLNEEKSFHEQIITQKEILQEGLNYAQAHLRSIEELNRIMPGRIEHGDISSIGFTPSQLVLDFIKLKKQMRDLEDNIRKVSTFRVVKDPIINSRPIRPKPFLTMTLAGLSAIMISVLIIALLAWWEKNKDA